MEVFLSSCQGLTYRSQQKPRVYLPQTWYELQGTPHDAVQAVDTYCYHQTVGQDTATAENNNHRLLKLRTDGSYARVRKLRSIDFVF